MSRRLLDRGGLRRLLPTGEEPDAATLEALRRAPGEDVAIVAGSADFAPGPVRLTFLVGADDRIRARFEATVPPRELEDALRRHLSG